MSADTAEMPYESASRGTSWWNRKDASVCLQNVKLGHMPPYKPVGTL